MGVVSQVLSKGKHSDPNRKCNSLKTTALIRSDQIERTRAQPLVVDVSPSKRRLVTKPPGHPTRSPCCPGFHQEKVPVGAGMSIHPEMQNGALGMSLPPQRKRKMEASAILTVGDVCCERLCFVSMLSV